jgi:hypothetical protein
LKEKTMKNSLSQRSTITLIMALAAGSIWAQAAAPTPASSTESDPARWYQRDMTRQARLAAMKKEINAALKEALLECKQAEASNRNSCIAEARQTHKTDLAEAEQKSINP